MVTGSALAADEIIMSEMKGTVMIGTDETRSIATKDMVVNEGDELVLAEDSLAILTYPNGCELTVNGQIEYTVPGEAPCAAGALVATAGAATAGASTTTVVVATVGALAVGAALLSDDDDETASLPDEEISK